MAVQQMDQHQVSASSISNGTEKVRSVHQDWAIQVLTEFVHTRQGLGMFSLFLLVDFQIYVKIHQMDKYTSVKHGHRLIQSDECRHNKNLLHLHFLTDLYILFPALAANSIFLWLTQFKDSFIHNNVLRQCEKLNDTSQLYVETYDFIIRRSTNRDRSSGESVRH